MLLGTMPLEATVSKETSGNVFPSSVWREVVGHTTAICQGEIEDMVEKKDQIPEQLFEAANIISEISSGISSLNDHKEDFQRLVGEAACLVVVFQQLYNNSNRSNRVLWPPPGLKWLIKELTDTVYRVHGFITRKCEKNIAKRMLVGCFGIRDRREFKKYRSMLDSVASGLESEPNMIDIHKVMLEFVRNRARFQGDFHIKQGTNQRPVIQEPIPKDPRLGRAGKERVKFQDLEESDSNASVGNQAAAKRPQKKKASSTPKQKVSTQPAGLPQHSISGFSFNSVGAENMTNCDVGNVYNSTITDAGNDDSVNHFHAQRKRVRD